MPPRIGGQGTGGVIMDRWRRRSEEVSRDQGHPALIRDGMARMARLM